MGYRTQGQGLSGFRPKAETTIAFETLTRSLISDEKQGNRMSKGGR